jgi:hypothetical protein
MDHFYQNIDGYMKDSNKVMFDVILDAFPKNGIWVELGSWTGKSAAYCLVELLNRNKLGRFVCVDTWEGGVEHQTHDFITKGNSKEIFQHNLKPITGKYEQLVSLSWNASSLFENNSVDFCYVDAGHTYEAVTKDLTAWWPKIKLGSYFAGDDYTKGWPGVQQAVFDFFKLLNVKVTKIGRCWVVMKS